jgi:hypothetical protein
VVVESFVNVKERRGHVRKLLLIREQLLFMWKWGRIFHCPGEQRRCHYSLGQTMLPSLHTVWSCAFLSWFHFVLVFITMIFKKKLAGVNGSVYNMLGFGCAEGVPVGAATRLIQLGFPLMTNFRSTGLSVRRGLTCCPRSSLLITIRFCTWEKGFCLGMFHDNLDIFLSELSPVMVILGFVPY